MKKHLVRIGFGVLVMLVFIGHAARYYRIPLIDRLEAILNDTRLRVTMPNGIDPRIVIVDIDEKSLKEPKDGGEGRWPWSRNRVALLITNLVELRRGGNSNGPTASADHLGSLYALGLAPPVEERDQGRSQWE